MKKNQILSFVAVFMLCITQSNALYAHETNTVKNALIAVKKIVGGSMLIVGGGMALAGVVAKIQGTEDISVAAMHQFFVVACLYIGIPIAILGLLIISLDEESWRE